MKRVYVCLHDQWYFISVCKYFSPWVQGHLQSSYRICFQIFTTEDFQNDLRKQFWPSLYTFKTKWLMVIHVKIGPQPPLVSCKRQLYGAVFQMTLKKLRPGPVAQHNSLTLWRNKDPSLLTETLSSKQRPAFCSPSTAIVVTMSHLRMSERFLSKSVRIKHAKIQTFPDSMPPS
jgi:hypothetical protein